jgi:prepilin signal peptidase PulO-like enzyme (type II secretory pathway)
MGVIMLLLFGKNRRAMMPLAPALALGTVISLLWGDALIDAFAAMLAV